MADNFTFKNASGSTLTAKSKDVSGVHIPATYLVDTSGNVATDDAAAAGPLYPIAGVYQSTVDLVDNGDVGRVRMTRRRGLMTAADCFTLVLDASNPNPSGNDILVGTSAPVASDFQIRDTNTRYFYIPIAEGGWRSCVVGFRIKSVSSFDQNMNISIRIAMGGDYNWAPSPLLACTIPVGSASLVFDSASASSTIGENIITSSAVNGQLAHVPAMGVAPAIRADISFSTAPTTGEFILYVARST